MLYEYECEACGVRFERRQSASDDPVKVCPECGGKVHRLIHPVGVIFKGKGYEYLKNPPSDRADYALIPVTPGDLAMEK